MLSVSHLSKTFDTQPLFKDISFSLNPGDRVGLIGQNGCGKTTLLHILAGIEAADSGAVLRDADLRIGYLPQGLNLDLERTIGEVIGFATGDPQALEIELAQAAAELVENPHQPIVQKRYDDLLRRIEASETGQVKQVLAGLGLDQVDPSVPVRRLSGGQQTRLSLALVLLSGPQLLLLDEPTNHLDIAMLTWLEEWLAGCPQAALIVSHDRLFLDRTVQRILAFDPYARTLREYAGGYSDYEQQRNAEMEKQWASYRDQELEIQRMRQDIARVKAQAEYTERQASSIRIGGPDMKIKGFKSYQQGIAKKVAKKAKSRERKLERFVESDDRVERPREDRTIHLAFHDTPHLGQLVIQLKELVVGYRPDVPLIHIEDLWVQARRRIVLTGPNGSGKTTLLRTIAGELSPLSGQVRLGPTVKLGVMTQDQSDLDPSLNSVETLAGTFDNETEVRNYLARYLIRGDEALKPAGQLSYGQRARLMLARLVANGCNCLLMDEPINHLDIPSRVQFEQALEGFEGAVLAVVHDRRFIEQFAEEVWWVENGQIRRDYARIDS